MDELGRPLQLSRQGTAPPPPTLAGASSSTAAATSSRLSYLPPPRDRGPMDPRSAATPGSPIASEPPQEQLAPAPTKSSFRSRLFSRPSKDTTASISRDKSIDTASNGTKRSSRPLSSSSASHVGGAPPAFGASYSGGEFRVESSDSSPALSTSQSLPKIGKSKGRNVFDKFGRKASGESSSSAVADTAVRPSSSRPSSRGAPSSLSTNGKPESGPISAGVLGSSPLGMLQPGQAVIAVGQEEENEEDDEDRPLISNGSIRNERKWERRSAVSSPEGSPEMQHGNTHTPVSSSFSYASPTSAAMQAAEMSTMPDPLDPDLEQIRPESSFSEGAHHRHLGAELIRMSVSRASVSSVASTTASFATAINTGPLPLSARNSHVPDDTLSLAQRIEAGRSRSSTIDRAVPMSSVSESHSSSGMTSMSAPHSGRPALVSQNSATSSIVLVGGMSASDSGHGMMGSVFGSSPPMVAEASPPSRGGLQRLGATRRRSSYMEDAGQASSPPSGRNAISGFAARRASRNVTMNAASLAKMAPGERLRAQLEATEPVASGSTFIGGRSRRVVLRRASWPSDVKALTAAGFKAKKGARHRKFYSCSASHVLPPDSFIFYRSAPTFPHGRGGPRRADLVTRETPWPGDCLRAAASNSVNRREQCLSSAYERL